MVLLISLSVASIASFADCVTLPAPTQQYFEMNTADLAHNDSPTFTLSIADGGSTRICRQLLELKLDGSERNISDTLNIMDQFMQSGKLHKLQNISICDLHGDKDARLYFSNGVDVGKLRGYTSGTQYTY